MSKEALEWAVKQRTKSAGARVALLVLAFRADAAGVTWPSMNCVAADMDMEVRGARRAVSELEAAGLVKRERRYRRSNMFRLPLTGTIVPGTVVPGMTVPGTMMLSDRHVGAARTEKELIEGRSLLRSAVPAAAGTSMPIAAKPFNARGAIWTEGLSLLMQITGKPSGAARSLMGKLLKAAGDDCAGMLLALRRCPESPEATAWLVKAAEKCSNTKRCLTETNREEWDLPTVADQSLLDDERKELVI